MKRRNIDWVKLATMDDRQYDSLCRSLESCWITRTRQADDCREMLREIGIENPRANTFETDSRNLETVLRMLGGWHVDEII